MSKADDSSRILSDLCFPEAFDQTCLDLTRQNALSDASIAQILTELCNGQGDHAHHYNKGLLLARSVANNDASNPQLKQLAIAALLTLFLTFRDKRSDMLDGLLKDYLALSGPDDTPERQEMISSSAQHFERRMKVISRAKHDLYPRARIAVNSRDYIRSALRLDEGERSPLPEDTDFFVMGTCFAENLAIALGNMNISSTHLFHREEIPVEVLLSKISEEKEFVSALQKAANPCLILTLGFAEFEVPSFDAADLDSGSTKVEGLEAFQSPEFICQSVVDGVNALLKINPATRVFITVSPVPLEGTSSDANVYEANSISKAIIRLAVAMACNKLPAATYFPSYEIVTQIAPSAGVSSFGDDDGHPRHVNKSLVSLICGLFIETYCPWATGKKD